MWTSAWGHIPVILKPIVWIFQAPTAADVYQAIQAMAKATAANWVSYWGFYNALITCILNNQYLNF